MCTHVLPSFVKETARCFDLNGVFIIIHICYKQLVFSGTLIDSLGCDGRGEACNECRSDAFKHVQALV